MESWKRVYIYIYLPAASTCEQRHGLRWQRCKIADFICAGRLKFMRRWHAKRTDSGRERTQKDRKRERKNKKTVRENELRRRWSERKERREKSVGTHVVTLSHVNNFVPEAFTIQEEEKETERERERGQKEANFLLKQDAKKKEWKSLFLRLIPVRIKRRQQEQQQRQPSQQ